MTQPEHRFPPRTVSDVIVDAFDLFRGNWTQYMLVAALAVIPLTLLAVAASRAIDVDDPEDLARAGSGLFLLLVGSVLSLVIQLVVTGALARSGTAALAGLPVDVGDGARHALLRLGGLLWVVILSALSVLAGLILLVIPGLIVAVLLNAAVPAFVVEGHKGGAALSRSWNLVKPYFWHVVGVVLLTTVVTFILQAVVEAITPDTFAGDWLAAVVASLVVVPYTALVGVVLYVELRGRNEGLTAGQLRDDLARTAEPGIPSPGA